MTSSLRTPTVTAPIESDQSEYIAIVGMATRLPGAPDLARFWALLAAGGEAIQSFSEQDLLAQGVDLRTLRDPKFVSAKGYLPDADQFDANFFGFSPREASLVDPQHRVMMEVAWEAMEHAGYDPEQWQGRCAIFTSAGMNTYLAFNIFTNPGLMEQVGGFQLSIYNDKDFVPTRIAYALNSRGPAVDIGTACSSSLVGVHLACQHLLTYQSDLALVGGVTIHLPQETGYLAEPGSAYSPDGKCRPFDATASGLVDGNGAAAIVLKRLSEAIDDGDTIHAVIRASAINNDGSQKVGYSAPSIQGQAEVIREAQALAGITADQISYIEAHGTATPLGDPIEVAGLTQAFRATTEARGFCGLGSVKSNIGHVDKAAGLAGLIKTVLALQHEAIPPNLHWKAPNPKLNLPETPFYVVDHLKAWPRSAQTPRIAGISSFGVGGTNAHAIVQEAPPPNPRATSQGPQVLVLSAKSESALASVQSRLRDHLLQNPGIDLGDVAHTLQVGRKRLNWRAALVCDSIDQACGRLAEPLVGQAPAASRRDTVFLFSGQGTQHAGMGRSLYQTEPVYRETIDRCALVLEPLLGVDIRTLLFAADDSVQTANAQLKQTALAQPALFATEYALAQLWMSWGVTPKAVLGHSLGEYVAACLAGVFSLEDGLRLVAERGRLMQAMQPGKMLAVSLPEQELVKQLAADHPDLDLAAVNGATQCVVAGPAEAVDALEQAMVSRGVMVRALQTSHAFHSRMMEPMLDSFAQALGRVSWQTPTLPLVSNVTCDWIDPEQLQSPAYWLEHVRQPVRFHAGLLCLAAWDANAAWLEVGPGRALVSLAGLVQRTPGSPAALASLPAPQSRADARSFMLETLGQWWTLGGEVTWGAVHGTARPRRVPLPTYPFERSRHWIEPGHRSTTRSTRDTDTTRQSNPAHWFYHVDWRNEALPAGQIDPTIRRVLIQGDGLLRDALVGAFEQAGLTVGSTLGPDEPLPDLVVYSPEALSTTDGEDLDSHSKPLLALIRTLLHRRPEQPLRLCVVGAQLLAMGSEAVTHPARAALAGLLRTVPYELNDSDCQTIDVAPATTRTVARVARQVVAETLQKTAAESVILRNGTRWVSTISTQTLPEPTTPTAGSAGLVRSQASYLLLGGVSDIGLVMARALVDAGAQRVVLTTTGSGAATVESMQTTMDEFRQRSHAEIVGLDLPAFSADAIQSLMAQAFDPERPWAGVIDATDMHAIKPVGLLETIEDATLADHWAQQHSHLCALEAGLSKTPLDYCLLMSTLAAQIGGTGQTAGTVAGLYTQAFAQQHNRSQADPWFVVQWDAWSQTDPEAISPAEGEMAMRLLLTLTEPGVIMIATRSPWARRHKALAAKVAKPASASHHATALHKRPNLASALCLPETEHQRTMAQIWQRFLGIETIGIDDDFFELGGNSLLAAQLLLEVKEAFGVTVDLAQLFAAANVRALSEQVLQAQVASSDESALLTQLEALEQLSDEEVERLLAQGKLPEQLIKALSADPG